MLQKKAIIFLFLSGTRKAPIKNVDLALEIQLWKLAIKILLSFKKKGRTTY